MKAEAILGAVRGGYINTLITDEEAAKAEYGQAGLSLSVFRHAGPGRAGTAQNTFSGCRIRSKSL